MLKEVWLSPLGGWWKKSADKTVQDLSKKVWSHNKLDSISTSFASCSELAGIKYTASLKLQHLPCWQTRMSNQPLCYFYGFFVPHCTTCQPPMKPVATLSLPASLLHDIIPADVTNVSQVHVCNIAIYSPLTKIILWTCRYERTFQGKTWHKWLMDAWSHITTGQLSNKPLQYAGTNTLLTYYTALPLKLIESIFGA